MKRTRSAIAGVLLMCMVGSAVASAQTEQLGYADGAQTMRVEVTTGQVDTISGVIYSQIKSQRGFRGLRMTLMVPRTNDLKPAIIYFPGGGFMSADHEKYTEMRVALSRAGFVVAAAEYRVVPDKFPAPVEDGKAAVRYLREHAAEYGIDPTRIGVIGDSAGGYVAQMVGTTSGETGFDKGEYLDKSSDVQAVATLYGISDLRSIGEGFPEAIQRVHQSPAVTEALLLNGPAFVSFAGAAVDADPAKALAASPMGHVNGVKPPFLIMHGTADTLVSPAQSKHLFEALKAGRNKVDYVLVEGAGHGDLKWYQAPVIDRVVNWFKQTLGGPVKGPERAANPGSRL